MRLQRAVPTSEKSALYSILDITSLDSADSVRCASNNEVGQFKPIFQVEGNTFRPIFLVISWLIDCSMTLPIEVFTQRNFVANVIRLKLNFIPKNWKIGFWAILWGLRGDAHTQSIARWKAMLYLLSAIIEFVRYLLRLRRYKPLRRLFDTDGGNAILVSEIAVSCGVKISAIHHLVLSQ